VIGVDEPYDREGDGPATETQRPSVPSGRPEIQQSPDQQSPKSPESPKTPESSGGPQAVENAGWPPPEPTGDERVDAALARFAELAAAPVAGHVSIFEDVQRRLQDVLASIDHDEAPGEQPEAEREAQSAERGAR
jgi:hypothetical protein